MGQKDRLAKVMEDVLSWMNRIRIDAQEQVKEMRKVEEEIKS